ncbi:MAG: hypothetical protein ACO260_00675 [Hylemonella sp.]|jgi:hypothetical protein
MRLVGTRAPQLPVAPPEYGQQERDKYSNILRLYFNTVDTTFANLLNGDGAGGKYLLFPYAAIQRTTDATFTANTATQITFDQNDYLNGCANDGTDGITVSQPGIYNYQFSVQLKNTDTQIHSAWIWLRKNGTDVPSTASKFDVISSHGGTPGYILAACNFFVDLEADDTVEMWAAVGNVAITFDAIAAQTVPFAMPAIPSVVATLSFVSNLAS